MLVAWRARLRLKLMSPPDDAGDDHVTREPQFLRR